MASALFTALALIAAGQAGPVPSATGAAQLSPPAASQTSAAAAKARPAAARSVQRRG